MDKFCQVLFEDQFIFFSGGPTTTCRLRRQTIRLDRTSPPRGSPSPRNSFRFENAYAIPEDLTLPAYFHLAAPADLRFSLTQGPIDEPAKATGLEFPRRATSPCFHGTVPDIPAGPGLAPSFILQREQEEHLALDMHGDLPPSLFKTLNRLQRGP